MARLSRRCEDCCKIATDDFNRADADDPGAAWDELQTGDADISSNTLLMAATPAETVIRFQTANPSGATVGTRVKVRFMLDSLADQCGVLMSGDGTAADMSPFCQAIIRQTGSCNELFLQGPNGLETSTQRLPGLTANEWHTLEVCFEPGDTSSSPEVAHVMRAVVTLASGMIYGDQLEITSLSNHTLGAHVGLRGYAGTKFDDFYFGWMQDETGPCKEMCPDCNTPCLIEEDNFDRADSTDLGCKWTEISGGWSITSNELACTSAGIALCAVHHPQDKTHHYVTARLLADTTRTPRILVNAKSDGSSYHWAQLSLSGTTLTLSIGKDGTTLDSVTSTLSPAAYVETVVCYDGSVLTATANGETVFSASTAVTDGTYAGLEGRGGQERFDDFEFQKHRSGSDPPDPTCPNCEEPPHPCNPCETGEGPQAFAVAISGVAGADGVLMNGTWVVFAFESNSCTEPHDFQLQCSPGSCCHWVGTFAGDLGTTYVSVVRVFVCGESIYVSVKYQCSLASGCCITGECKVRFSRDYGPDAVPCTELLNAVLPLMSNGAAPTLDVDTTNAVCEVTAL